MIGENGVYSDKIPMSYNNRCLILIFFAINI